MVNFLKRLYFVIKFLVICMNMILYLYFLCCILTFHQRCDFLIPMLYTSIWYCFISVVKFSWENTVPSSARTQRMEPVSCVTLPHRHCEIQSQMPLLGSLESAGELFPSCLHVRGRPLRLRRWKANPSLNGEKHGNLNKWQTNDIYDPLEYAQHNDCLLYTSDAADE